ncbi:YeeE/YedE family protein [Roseobacter sp.]|uniref:YeeE/YedE family protein n=1 Tax=Roseobacter sp. TaxID=1907202 RepID=UPI00385FD9C1
MEALLDQFGANSLMLVSGFGIGGAFGLAAYRSKFCLRAATVELSEGRFGRQLSVWLIAFLSALISVQAAIWGGFLDVSMSRQLSTTGSVSGAILGGLLFGIGMILARGCASRLLVLSASGNLRAIVTGLVLTLTAQASLRGVLAPLRETLATIWTIDGGAARYLIHLNSELATPFLVVCGLALTAVLKIGYRKGLSRAELLTASCVGIAVFAGWQLTYLIAQSSFEVVSVQSVTFTGPATDTLMGLVNERHLPAGFGLGLVPGVFAGAMVMAVLKGEARLQRFGPDIPMERYLFGGILMGFGSMLAGGCAVGAGLTGGSVLAMTAWVAVFFMWVGAMSTNWVLQRVATLELA